MSPSDKKMQHALQGAPKLVTATVALMEELIRVLLQEADIVVHRKLKEHPQILQKKQRLAMDYRNNMKALTAQPDILRQSPDEARAAFKEMVQKLSKAIQDNARTLGAAVSAAQQLMQNIMTMIRSEVLPKNTYSNHTKAHLQLGVYSPTCKPVAVSRSV